jgi:hypothetical protein
MAGRKLRVKVVVEGIGEMAGRKLRVKVVVECIDK